MGSFLEGLPSCFDLDVGFCPILDLRGCLKLFGVEGFGDSHCPSDLALASIVRFSGDMNTAICEDFSSCLVV